MSAGSSNPVPAADPAPRTAASSATGWLRATLISGLAGALLVDIYLVVTEGYFLHSGLTAQGLSQWDASNFLGKAAFSGGWGTAFFGMFCHAIVSLILAAIFVFAALRWPWLRRLPLATGAAYGVVIRVVMADVIVPLGRAKLPPHPTAIYLTNNYLAHVLAFGIPVVWIATRLLPKRRSPAAKPA